jgi:hypothetical protein
MRLHLVSIFSFALILAGCDTASSKAKQQKPARPKRMLELQLSARSIRAFDPVIAKVVVHNPWPKGGEDIRVNTIPSAIGFELQRVGSNTWRPMQSKEKALPRDASVSVPGIIVPAGQSRIAAYQVLFPPEPGELTIPGEYLLRATKGQAFSPPVKISVVDCLYQEGKQIERLLPQCYTAIGVRRTLVLGNSESIGQLVLPRDVDLNDLASDLRQLERKLHSPSKLKQTLQWTLAFGRLKENSSARTRREALAEVLKIQKQCDPLTQEAIDASLLYFVQLGRVDVDEGEKILRRRADLIGWPWDFARAALPQIREEQKALRGAKPVPEPKEPLRGPLAVGRTERTESGPPYDFFNS